MQELIRNSHIGIYGLIKNKSTNEILVIKKARGPYKNKFDLPGGSPEFEEELEQTLIREIMEETGLTVRKFQYLANVLAIFKLNQFFYRHLGIIYEITELIGKIKTNSDGEDSLGCAWIDPQDLTESNSSALLWKLKLKYFI